MIAPSRHRPGAGRSAAGTGRAAARRQRSSLRPPSAAPRRRRGSRHVAPATRRRQPSGRDTPVSVRANSWIELRAPDGDVLAQTYVRAGESYVVPAGIAYRIIDAR